ncbi:M24 family metallopeptidase [Thermodesulfobacteriota bacterium]
MGISKQEFERRYGLIRERMENDDLDCILIVGLSDDFNRGNIRYITGSGRGGCCIFPVEGPPIFLIAPIQSASPKLPRLMAAIDLLDLREAAIPEEQALIELSRLSNGNKVGVVGMACMSAPMHRSVTEEFGDRLVDSMEIFESLRVIKSEEEIEKTRTAASIADHVYTRLREMIQPGLGEHKIYGEVKKIIYEMGCEYSFDLIDAAGSSMNMSFFPTEDKLEASGTLFMEITPAYEGYYAQLPVTLPVGTYSNNPQKMVSAWARADKTAQKILRPGTKVSDLYHTLVNSIQESGFKSPYRPGHSIGLEVLDFWSITESNTRILKPGMTIAVHPSVLQEMGGDGCGMGYTYLITDRGADRLSKVDLAEELLG